ncbi:methyl-accepting chemotaxis protein [Arcobacter sp.]|uniref:methyl-accepting chemotaxis protein n=1 Tax=Arcobacter sp. TaxID=1872629 RepID=UPI003D14C072
MKNFSIRIKLFIVSILSALSIIVLTIIINYNVTQISQMQEIKGDAITLTNKILNLMRLEKNFSLTHDENIKKEFDLLYKKEIQYINYLTAELDSYGLPSDGVKNYTNKLSDYNLEFQKLFTTIQEIGFTRDFGDYGELRKVIKKATTLIKLKKDEVLFSHVQELRKLEMEFIITQSDKYEQEIIEKIKEIFELINQSNLLEELEQKDLLSYFDNYQTIFKKIVVNINKLGFYKKEGLYPKLNFIISDAQKNLNTVVININEILEEKIRQYQINIWIVSIFFITLILTILYYISSKTIVTPIKNFEKGLIDFFKYLNNEINDVSLLNLNTKDELGNMAEIVNKNIIKTKKLLEEDKSLINETIVVLEEFEKGDLSQRIQTISNNPSLNELKNVFNKMAINLEKNVKNILTVLDKYTKYNYLDEVNNLHLNKDLLELANGVNTLGNSITNMLITNKTIGTELNNSSNTLLLSVDKLNNNTVEAARSIEETSISLDEITKKIIENNENVEKMSSYTNELTISVKDGEKLAQQTANAMDEITERVTSINEALNLIDQIAFQTNILSLNAAVEAATAGEAGKGFAVVAQEVRNLANRSAEAAKEIKDMVENANTKANEGKQISDDMINGYSNLSSNINETILLINSVSESSKTQEKEMNQINSLVSQLDKKTQENLEVSQSTFDMASKTNQISNQVVKETNTKIFKGKD